jgi:hypothetical protein
MISIIKGTDNSITITFKENNVAIDITGYTILFTVKKQCDINKDDDFALIEKTITTHSDPTHGESTLILSSTDTDIDEGNYYWDLRLIKDGVITQTQRDNLEITNGITTRKLD